MSFENLVQEIYFFRPPNSVLSLCPCPEGWNRNRSNCAQTYELILFTGPTVFRKICPIGRRLAMMNLRMRLKFSTAVGFQSELPGSKRPNGGFKGAADAAPPLIGLRVDGVLLQPHYDVVMSAMSFAVCERHRTTRTHRSPRKQLSDCWLMPRNIHQFVHSKIHPSTRPYIHPVACRRYNARGQRGFLMPRRSRNFFLSNHLQNFSHL